MFLNKRIAAGFFLYVGTTLCLGILTGNFAAAVCFALAAYAVVANDSVQTLMTYMNSNRDLDWRILYAWVTVVLLATLWGGWIINGGDITYGRLEAKGYEDIQITWIYVIFPLTLLFLTYKGVPVSTSLLMLSIFSSSLLFQKIVLKSAVGYLIAFSVSFIIWFLTESFLRKKPYRESGAAPIYWRLIQAGTTTLLLFTWLTHDLVNMAVFLPSKPTFWMMVAISALFVIGHIYTFVSHGGAVGKIVTKKTNTADIVSATMIDGIYFVILLVFKEWNNLPMSTTWVFVGLLAGRQLAIRTINRMDLVGPEKNRFKVAAKEIWKDLWKIVLGLGFSVLTLYAVQWYTGKLG